VSFSGPINIIIPLAINANFSNPKAPPKILFTNPKAANFATLVSNFPSKEIPTIIPINPLLIQ